MDEPQSLPDNESRLRKQNQVLRDLARSKSFANGHLDRALKEITEAAAHTLEVERVNIWLFDKDRSKIRCLDQYERSNGLHTQGIEEVTAASSPAYFKTLEEERLIAVSEAQTDPRTQELTASYLQLHQITSLLDAPIRLKGQMVGIICHEHVGPPRQWPPEEQYFAGSMADFVALALEADERKRAEEGLKRYAERLKILHEIDQAILQAQSPEMIAQTALGHIRRLVSCQRAGLTLYDFAANEMVLLAVDTEAGTTIDAGRREPLEPYLSWLETLRSCKTFVPITPQLHIETIQVLYDEGVRSGISLPLLARDVLIGSVNLWMAREDISSLEHIEIAREVTDQLAIALQQARLFAETQRRITELAGLHEIAQAFGALTDVRETFGVLAEQLAHLIGAQMCMVLLLEPATGEMQAQAPGYGVNEAILASFCYPAPSGQKMHDTHYQRPFKANSPTEIPLFFDETLQDAKPESMLIVPMWVERQIIGQVAAGNKPGGFQEDDVRLLQMFANQAAIVIQNARLFEAEALRRQEAEALRDTAGLLNTTLDLNEVLDRILTNVDRVVPHDAANIMLIEAGIARIVRSRGYARYGLEAAVKALRFSVTETSNLRQIVESRQAIVISDTRTDPEWIFSWVHSYLGAPMYIKTEVIGFLNLDSKTPGFFTQAHAERLQAFADQAAVAIENARLYAESEQRANRLKILHGIDQSILAAQSPEHIGQVALDRVRQLVACERASLILLDFAADEAIIFAVSVEADTLPDTGSRIPLSTLPDLAELSQGQFQMVQDIATLAQRNPLQEKRLREEGIRSYLNLPLISQEGLVGTLNLARTTPGPWSVPHLEIAREVADQLAIAIHQARLREQIGHYAGELERRVADRTRELSAIYEITAVASESLSLEVMLEQSLTRVLEAMNSQAGTIHLLDQSGENIYLAVQKGLSPDMVAWLADLPSTTDPLGWIIRHGDPLIISDIAADPRTAGVLSLTIQAYAGAPMRARGRILGVLNIFREKDQSPFKVEEVALLTSIADHAGVVVESARLRQQAERTAVMEERARLARDLHDSVTQLLYSVNLFAATGLEAARLGNREQVQHCLAELRGIAQQALKEMRLLVYQLRPSALEHDGLVGALQQRLEAVEGRAGVKTRLRADSVLELPGLVEEALYHIAQEALNNAMKHALATSVSIQIQAGDQQVNLEITDNGIGFDPEAVAGKGGLGLVSMRERMEKLGGKVTICSKPGEGTKIIVQVPIP